MLRDGLVACIESSSSGTSTTSTSILVSLENGTVHRSYRPLTTAIAKNVSDGCVSPPPICMLPGCNAFLAAEDRRVVMLYGPNVQQPAARWIMPEPVSALAISRCGRFLFAGADGGQGCVYVWSLETGDLLRLLKGHMRRVTHLSVSHAFVASGSNDGSCRVYGFPGLLKGDRPLATIVGHSLPVTCTSFFNLSPWLLITGSSDATCRLHDLRSCTALDDAQQQHSVARGRQVARWSMSFSVTCVAIDGDDRSFFAGGSNGDISWVQLGDDHGAVEPRRLRTPHQGHQVIHVASVGDSWLSLDAAGTAVVWDRHTLTVTRELYDLRRSVVSAATLFRGEGAATPFHLAAAGRPTQRQFFDINRPANYFSSINNASLKRAVSLVESDGCQLPAATLKNVDLNAVARSSRTPIGASKRGRDGDRRLTLLANEIFREVMES